MHPLDGDGSGVTRPFPRVVDRATTATLPPPTPPPPPAPPPRTGPPGGDDGTGGGRAPYVHRFGSLPFYLFARAVAFAIDAFGVTLFLAAAIRAAAISQHVPLDIASVGGFGVLLGSAFGAAIALAFVCEALVGTTLGKIIFALHVRRRDGTRVGLARVFIRTLLYPIDLPLVGLVAAALTPRRQRVGDLAAGTVVSRSGIGSFASVIGIVVAIGLVYVQAAFLGGADAARQIAGETATYGPGFVSTLAGFARGAGGAVAPKTPASPAASPAEPAQPSLEPTAEPSPVESASAEPTAAASATPSPPPAEPTDLPSGAPSDAPITRPSPAMPTDTPVPEPTVTA